MLKKRRDLREANSFPTYLEHVFFFFFYDNLKFSIVYYQWL